MSGCDANDICIFCHAIWLLNKHIMILLNPVSYSLSSLQPGPPPLGLPGGLCPGLQTVGSVHHRPRVWKTLLCLVRHEQWRGMDCVPETA